MQNAPGYGCWFCPEMPNSFATGANGGWIMFIPQMKHTRVRLELDWVHLFKQVSVWLFWPAPEFDCCVHTDSNEPHWGGKLTKARLNQTKQGRCEKILKLGQRAQGHRFVSEDFKILTMCDTFYPNIYKCQKTNLVETLYKKNRTSICKDSDDKSTCYLNSQWRWFCL